MSDRAGGLGHISHNSSGQILGHSGGRSNTDTGANSTGDGGAGRGRAGSISSLRRGNSTGGADRARIVGRVGGRQCDS
jgi:hypothetical protein